MGICATAGLGTQRKRAGSREQGAGKDDARGRRTVARKGMLLPTPSSLLPLGVDDSFPLIYYVPQGLGRGGLKCGLTIGPSRC